MISEINFQESEIFKYKPGRQMPGASRYVRQKNSDFDFKVIKLMWNYSLKTVKDFLQGLEKFLNKYSAEINLYVQETFPDFTTEWKFFVFLCY